MTAQYTVASLEELAARFDQFAADEDAVVPLLRSERAKHACAIMAKTWRNAASILRNTTIQGTPHDAR